MHLDSFTPEWGSIHLVVQNPIYHAYRAPESDDNFVQARMQRDHRFSSVIFIVKDLKFCDGLVKVVTIRACQICQACRTVDRGREIVVILKLLDVQGDRSGSFDWAGIVENRTIP